MKKLLIIFIFFLVTKSLYCQWIWQDSSYKDINFTTIKFLNSDNGWALGENGTILKYNGQNWTKQASNTKKTILDASFIDIMHGWAVVDSNSILRYNYTWTKNTLSSSSLQAINFIDANNGWAVGRLGEIYKYANNIWTIEESNSQSYLTSVDFVSTIKGWAVGITPGTIIHYDGLNWSTQYKNINNSDGLYSVYFVDETHGWAVGDNGLIMKYDGKNWTKEMSGTNKWLRSVYFTDTLHGWAVGEQGIVLKYDGNLWSIHQTKYNEMFTSVYFLDSLHGWIAGSGGKILYTNNGGVVNGINKNENFYTVDVYPNPVTGKSYININTKIKDKYHMELLDNTGRKIKESVPKVIINNSIIQLDMEDLDKGIYYCRIISGKNIITRKVIKI